MEPQKKEQKGKRKWAFSAFQIRDRRHHKPPLRGGQQHAAAQHATYMRSGSSERRKTNAKQQIMRLQLEDVSSLTLPQKTAEGTATAQTGGRLIS
jgi:hypothetical protein